MYVKNKDGFALMDYSFYPIKEMLVEILSVADEKKDFRSAFLLVLSTQKISLHVPDGYEAKLLGEYYYTLGVIRNRAFWNAAFSTYREVKYIEAAGRFEPSDGRRRGLPTDHRAELHLDVVLRKEQRGLCRDNTDVHQK